MRPDAKRFHHKRETAAHILTAARSLFAMHGYETVTMRDVARAAGRSTGAIFASWPGKADLFAEAMGRPHIPDALAAELLAELKTIAPERADELMRRAA